MKALMTGTVALSFCILGAMIVLHAPPQTSNAWPATNRTPVVVELFTSEGCSSCPPADALLAGLALQQPIENVDVIALEEHVDYWNELGWVDPFSSHEWTARQYGYSGVLGNGNPYTPQMVVDGKTEFVGSQARKARQVISESARTEKAQVTLVPGSTGKSDAESLSVKVGKLPATKQHDTAEVWLAITETRLHSAVKRGENAGEDLHHAAIVRTIRKIGEAKGVGETSFAGDVSVPLQQEWKRENLSAVVFVQAKKGRQILGAAELPVAR
jgi:hypothetical protein